MKIIFLCHGNICRSPMAEYIFKHLVSRNNLSDSFDIISRATSNEEYNNDIYPLSKKVLKEISINDENEYVREVAKKRMNL